MIIFYWLRFETSGTWRVRPLYLCPSRIGRSSYTPGTGFTFRRLLRHTGLRRRCRSCWIMNIGGRITTQKYSWYLLLYHFINTCGTISACSSWSDTWAYTWSWSQVALRILVVFNISRCCCYISICCCGVSLELPHCISSELLYPYCVCTVLLRTVGRTSKSLYDWRSVVNMSSYPVPLWNLWPYITSCRNVTV
jgi:hypothetical protein